MSQDRSNQKQDEPKIDPEEVLRRMLNTPPPKKEPVKKKKPAK